MRKPDLEGSSTAPALLLSAGSEVVTVSLAEELSEHGIPIAVLSFGQPSVLASWSKLVAYERIVWPAPAEQVIEKIARFVEPLATAAGSPLVAFATDDATLRMLVENLPRLEQLIRVPRAVALPSGGLDKAEFFDFLRANGLEDLCPRTQILHHPSELERAFDVLGTDLVLKPVLKPLRTQLALDATGRKLLSAADYSSPAALAEALADHWPFSSSWLAQERLITPSEGEAVAWVARGPTGELRQVCAFERWKHPRSGGTGCWLETRPDPQIDEAGRRLAEALGLVGLAEFPFLKDASGRWRVLECNPRAWLQVALARIAGSPLAAYTWALLSGSGLEVEQAPLSQRTWVNAEMLLLAAASGDHGARGAAFHTALNLMRSADYTAMYSAPWPFVRRAWLRRVGAKLVRRVVGR